MQIDLSGRRALVCGSTQGIGRATATALAQCGAEVTLLARNDDALEKVRDELSTDHGQTHRWLAADFSNWQHLPTLVASHLHDHGPVQILVNNTGGPPPGPAFEAAPEQYIKAFEQHLLCNHLLVNATAVGMRDAQYGRIINIISTSVKQPIMGLGVSNTIRGAVASWAKTLSRELGPFGITVNNVLPGFTKTARLDAIIKGKAERAAASIDEIENEMMATIPARRFAEPEETAAAVAFLASPLASYINGVSLPVDGGRLEAL